MQAWILLMACCAQTGCNMERLIVLASFELKLIVINGININTRTIIFWGGKRKI